MNIKSTVVLKRKRNRKAHSILKSRLDYIKLRLPFKKTIPCCDQ